MLALIVCPSRVVAAFWIDALHRISYKAGTPSTGEAGASPALPRNGEQADGLQARIPAGGATQLHSPAGEKEDLPCSR